MISRNVACTALNSGLLSVLALRHGGKWDGQLLLLLTLEGISLLILRAAASFGGVLR